jgi:hypothetical protein
MLSFRGGREEPAILRFRRRGRAHGAAVDTGGPYGGEEDTVEARIPGSHCAVTGFVIQRHYPVIAWRTLRVSPFSDMNEFCPSKANLAADERPMNADKQNTEQSQFGFASCRAKPISIRLSKNMKSADSQLLFVRSLARPECATVT